MQPVVEACSAATRKSSAGGLCTRCSHLSAGGAPLSYSSSSCSRLSRALLPRWGLLGALSHDSFGGRLGVHDLPGLLLPSSWTEGNPHLSWTKNFASTLQGAEVHARTWDRDARSSASRPLAAAARTCQLPPCKNGAVFEQQGAVPR